MSVYVQPYPLSQRVPLLDLSPDLLVVLYEDRDGVWTQGLDVPRPTVGTDVGTGRGVLRTVEGMGPDDRSLWAVRLPERLTGRGPMTSEWPPGPGPGPGPVPTEDGVVLSRRGFHPRRGPRGDSVRPRGVPSVTVGVSGPHV